jgi:hypothetical protein
MSEKARQMVLRAAYSGSCPSDAELAAMPDDEREFWKGTFGVRSRRIVQELTSALNDAGIVQN